MGSYERDGDDPALVSRSWLFARGAHRGICNPALRADPSIVVGDFVVSGRTVTLRMPRAFSDVDSRSVRDWLLEFCRQPQTNLPAVSFALPKRAVKMASAVLDESRSGAIRRIIAARVSTLPPGALFFLVVSIAS